MKWFIFCWCFVLTACIYANDEVQCSSPDQSCSVEDKAIIQYFQRLDERLKDLHSHENELKYQYNCNVTEENQLKMNEIVSKNAKIYQQIAEEIKNLGYLTSKNEFIQRQAKILSALNYEVLPESEHKELINAISRMQTNYAKVLVCEYNNSSNCKMALEPEIEGRIRDSRDPDELQYYWKEFYDKAGTPIKNDFKIYVELTRKAAILNNFTSKAEHWISKYEDPDFEKNIEDIYQEILPFYQQLHGYARYRLRKKYGEDVMPEKGNIPMHILGNLWGQTWQNILDILQPYPEEKPFDITEEMINQGYTATKIFEMGDEFFQSLNMKKLPKDFWDKSVLEKPTDRNIICHASAWDFFKTDDVRIKQCTKVNQGHFYIAHHELGHIQYYLLYQHLPVAFRYCPNPGFHEAVGDTIALSVTTPKHLQAIGLLKDFEYNEKNRINHLFDMALKKIVFLPFAYTLDKYRYEVFRNKISANELNCAFWKMRSELGGIEPAVCRSEKDFDPTAKYHVTADVEYSRYFTAHIFQFQFHKAGCVKAGQYVKGNCDLTLDNCDIHGSKEAGNAFKSMLELGRSKNWKDALESFTGERQMTASALLEYFEPLKLWLEAENKKLNVPIGWDVTQKCIKEN